MQEPESDSDTAKIRSNLLDLNRDVSLLLGIQDTLTKALERAREKLIIP